MLNQTFINYSTAPTETSGSSKDYIEVTSNVSTNIDAFFNEVLMSDGFLLSWSDFIQKAYPVSGAVPYNGYPGSQKYCDFFENPHIYYIDGKSFFKVSTKPYWVNMSLDGGPYSLHKLNLVPEFRFSNFKLFIDPESVVLDTDSTIVNSKLSNEYKQTGEAVNNSNKYNAETSYSIQIRKGTSWSNTISEGSSSTTTISESFKVGLPVGTESTTTVSAAFTKDNSWSETTGEDNIIVTTVTGTAPVQPLSKKEVTITMYDDEGVTPYIAKAYFEYNLEVSMYDSVNAHRANDTCASDSTKPQDTTLIPKIIGGFYTLPVLKSYHQQDDPVNGTFIYGENYPFSTLLLGQGLGKNKIREDTEGVTAIDVIQYQYDIRNVSGGLFDWTSSTSLLKQYAAEDVYNGNPLTPSMSNLLKLKYGGNYKGEFAAHSVIRTYTEFGPDIPL